LWEQQPNLLYWNVQAKNLAHLLIARYVGHFLCMSLALQSLTTENEFFTIDMGLNPIDNNITKVLELFPLEGLVYLWLLAEHGFAPVPKPEDHVEEMIVRSNTGGIITKKVHSCWATNFHLEAMFYWIGPNIGECPQCDSCRSCEV
jgi:hypothetical protein